MRRIFLRAFDGLFVNRVHHAAADLDDDRLGALVADYDPLQYAFRHSYSFAFLAAFFGAALVFGAFGAAVVDGAVALPPISVLACAMVRRTSLKRPRFSSWPVEACMRRLNC